MNPFPERHALISLFAAEPRLMDPDLPWHCNTLDFTTTVGDEQLEVTIEASYGELTLRWSRAGRELLNLVLHDVASLAVECERGREALLVTFAAARRLAPLRLQVRPHVHFLGGTVR